MQAANDTKTHLSDTSGNQLNETSGNQLNDTSGNHLNDTRGNSRFTQPEWLASAAVGGIAIACVTWIVIAFAVHGIRRHKWQRVNDKTKPGNGLSPVLISSLAAAAFAWLRLVSSQFAFNVGYGVEDSQLCDIVLDLSAVFYTCFYLSYYLALWFRLNRLYANVARIHALSPWMRLLKWLTLVFATSGVVASVAVYTYKLDFTSSRRGCVDRHQSPVFWPLYLVFAVVLLSQAAMIFQFLRPLRFQLRGSNAARIRQIAKRLTAAASLCVITDLLAVVANVILVPGDATKHVNQLLFDVNVVVDLLCVLLTFVSWRSIVLCRRGKAEIPVGSPQPSALTASSGNI